MLKICRPPFVVLATKFKFKDTIMFVHGDECLVVKSQKVEKNNIQKCREDLGVPYYGAGNRKMPRDDHQIFNEVLDLRK